MDRNVGGTDRTARLIAGPLLLVAGTVGALLATGQSALFAAVFVLILGLDLLVTALLQRCPANYLLGVDTCRLDTTDV
ncbi:MAG: DUF2892 domain-containing protein [Haloarculaceae archaeon]